MKRNPVLVRKSPASQFSSIAQVQSTMGNPLVLSTLPRAYEGRCCPNVFQMYINAQLSAVFILPTLFEALFGNIWIYLVVTSILLNN